MYKFKNSLIALIGMVSLMTVVTVVIPHTSYGSGGTATSSPSTTQTQNVKVVNTPAEPVPIQGTATVNGTVQAAQSGAWSVGINGTPNVNIANTAAVNAQQSGTWEVGITGTPNINIANMPTVGLDPASNTVKVGNDLANPVLVRDIDNPARNAVRLLSGGSFIDQGSTTGTFETDQLQDFTVPNGKRLVIENLSIAGNVVSDATVLCELSETPGSIGFPLIFISLAQVRPNIWRAYQSVRLYVEPSHQIQWTCSRYGGGQIQVADYRLIANGYLVTIP